MTTIYEHLVYQARTSHRLDPWVLVEIYRRQVRLRGITEGIGQLAEVLRETTLTFQEAARAFGELAEVLRKSDLREEGTT